MSQLNVACDLDRTVFSFPKFFKDFFEAMQAGHNKVGILTARGTSQKKELVEAVKTIGINPDFFITMPDDLRDTHMGVGIFKGKICKDLNIDILFDDFVYSDPKIIADFFSVNTTTIPFTSWAYKPDSEE